MQTFKITQKAISIRRHPWITNDYEAVLTELHPGDVISYNPNNICYDWTNERFYACTTPAGDGWINAKVVANE